MATAIIMHGAEGTGKNLFWNTVKAIYGRYGVIIGQAQIESEFNQWLSARLFIIGNEVLGRREKWELRGALKHLVTEDEIYINEKNMPERVEHNHANLVFLSNEVQPLVLGHGDRRYLVVDCWKVHPDGEAFYQAVRDEMANGGVEAFYHLLLNLDLGDFAPHSKPPDTEAKRELVNLGQDEPERFLDQWRAGMLELPYGAATAEDLYSAFRRWCQRQGERHVPSMTRFGRQAKVRFRAGVKRLMLLKGSRTDDHQRTIYWDEEAIPDTVERLDVWLRDAVQKFRDAAFDPLRGEDE
jgi:putative DNA primase/helicase